MRIGENTPGIGCRCGTSRTASKADCPPPKGAIRPQLQGSVLPTIIVVSVVMLAGMLGLFALWEHETLLFARSCRLRQARADVESTYTLYGLFPRNGELTVSDGFQLYDSLPGSRVTTDVLPWGLYDAVFVRTADSLLDACRLFGAEPESAATLFYADNRSAVTLAGQSVLQGTLRLPRNGLIYGRVGSDFYRGPEVSRTAIRRAGNRLTAPDEEAETRIDALLSREPQIARGTLPDSLHRSFLHHPTTVFRLERARIGECTLRGRIVLYADDLRIDSTCRMEHILVCARKITVGSGARIAAQLFARDTVIVEPGAALEYPSGIYAGVYAGIGDRAEVNGYVIVLDTLPREKVAPNYRQSRTARLRGLLWVEGIAQVQGIVAGRAVLRQAAYFSPQGYYKDMLYEVTLLENPITAQPLWLPSVRRKEAVCVD